MFSEVTSIIEYGLKSMNESTFQKLSHDFLNFKGYNFIGALGAVADTTSGNVWAIWSDDGYVITHDSSWIFTDLYCS